MALRFMNPYNFIASPNIDRRLILDAKMPSTPTRQESNPLSQARHVYERVEKNTQVANHAQQHHYQGPARGAAAEAETGDQHGPLVGGLLERLLLRPQQHPQATAVVRAAPRAPEGALQRALPEGCLRDSNKTPIIAC
ncbi:hypothetical protein DL770_007454 [Monosporascus sp. CRB-9-2]|nr:hypothetical protein DL770_007454 [Monosporascus sp. CRB-9-2]